jgi:hypothetical protein
MIAGCALANDPLTEKEASEPLLLTNIHVDIEGVLPFGGTAFSENPTTLLEAKDFHGYEFDGLAGGVVTITMLSTSGKCGSPDTLLDLFGPEDVNGNRGASIAENDDAFIFPCNLDSRIKSFKLPVTGGYLIVATSFLQQGGGSNGHYKLTLSCDNGACTDPDAPSFAGTRISQADIDAGVFSPEDLFEVGDFLFEFAYQKNNGLGNAIIGLPAGNSPQPNFRQIPNNVHFKAFGAPEAQTCISCHNVGGEDGAGDNNHNIFQIGDGVNRNSGVPRNPITVLGLGYREAAAAEMTIEIQGKLKAGKDKAAASGADVSVALTSKTINFGTVIAHADQTVDFTGLRGVDPDLIVRPFGWKGRENTICRFIEGGWRVHFGM